MIYLFIYFMFLCMFKTVVLLAAIKRTKKKHCLITENLLAVFSETIQKELVMLGSTHPKTDQSFTQAQNIYSSLLFCQFCACYANFWKAAAYTQKSWQVRVATGVKLCVPAVPKELSER